MIHLIPHGEVNPQGLPAGWPKQVARDEGPARQSPWQSFSEAEYRAYIDALRPAYVAWEAQRAQDPEPRRQELRQLLARRRWEVETGGLVFNGLAVSTDPVSQAKVNGAVTTTLINPSFQTHWKGSDGVWHPLDAQAIQALGLAVSAHVAACFAKEEAFAVQVAAAATREDLEALQAVIEAPWVLT